MKKLGFGTMRLPLISGGGQKAIDQEQVNRMADHFLANGFTYVDTAYMYHDYTSEIAVRKAFSERYPRDSFLLADKLPVASLKTRADYERTFNEQLEKCGVEYFDYYLIHDINALTIDGVEKNDAFGFLAEKKAKGLIRHMGFSFHDGAELLDSVLARHPETEFVQLQLNYVDWDDEAIQSRKNYETCVKHGKKVTVMEPVKGGKLADVPAEAKELFDAYNKDASPASWAVRYAASLDSVMIVLSGMTSFEQMVDNTSYMKDFVPLNNDERDVISKTVGIIQNSYAVACTGCRYCVNHAPGCPMNIAIPEYFAIYNNVHQFGSGWGTRQAYRGLIKNNGAPSDCIQCGQCEEHCPQHINIIEVLKQVPVL